MQIWFLDPSPIKSAEILYKKSPQRARKFVIEFMQAVAMLCEKHDLPLPIKKDGTPYKTKLASRFPKPLMEWLDINWRSLAWCCDMVLHLSFLTGSTIYAQNWCYTKPLIEKIVKLKGDNVKFTPLPNYAKSKAKGLDFTHIKDTCKAYNLYLDAQL